jgi:hypothetical protein
VRDSFPGAIIFTLNAITFCARGNKTELIYSPGLKVENYRRVPTSAPSRLHTKGERRCVHSFLRTFAAIIYPWLSVLVGPHTQRGLRVKILIAPKLNALVFNPFRGRFLFLRIFALCVHYFDVAS